MLDPVVLAALRGYTLEKRGLVDGALLSGLSPEARERAITGAMVACVADLCAGDYSVVETLARFVQEHVALNV